MRYRSDRLCAGRMWAWTVGESVRSGSGVPLLVASNIEAGGNGACTDGTSVATPLQTASTPETDAGYEMGLVGGRQSRALGCNWAFTPMVDIHHSWRNTVIATRAFGNDHATVIRYAGAFSEGVRDGAGHRPMALCMKHLPGDGRDERDRHVVTSPTPRRQRRCGPSWPS